MYRAKITVTLRKSILDPQGKAVEQSIHSLGYGTVENVRIGKFIELTVDTKSREEAERLTNDVCRKLLANPVMEDFSFVVEEED
ncbi:MAG TPA: phosphoribosylformylglycinamidine synthase subunit PurS [Bacteroidota bacterium]